MKKLRIFHRPLLYKHEMAAPKIQILNGSEIDTIKWGCWLLVDLKCLFSISCNNNFSKGNLKYSMDPYKNKTNTLEFEKTSSNEIFRCFQNHILCLHWKKTFKTNHWPLWTGKGCFLNLNFRWKWNRDHLLLIDKTCLHSLHFDKSNTQNKFSKTEFEILASINTKCLFLIRHI